MALNYIVVLDNPAAVVPGFHPQYFPRGFHYKLDANALVGEVKAKGFKAHVVPKAQFTPALLRKVKG